MDSSHKWYKVAKAWVEGAEIEFLTASKVWVPIESPTFIDDREYRIKSHVHQELMDAFAKGAEIQYLNTTGDWCATTTPTWDTNTRYRIKPKSDIIKRRWICYVESRDLVPTFLDKPSPAIVDNCPVTQVDFIFDGKTGKFKGVSIPPQP